MVWTKRYLTCLGGLALAAGPLCSQGQDYIDLEAERLQQQQADVQQSAPETPGTVDSGSVDSSGYGSGGSSAGELYYQLQLLQQEVMQLRGMVEEQDYQIRQLKEQSLERYLDLDRRLKEGGGQGTATTQPGTTPSTPSWVTTTLR